MIVNFWINYQLDLKSQLNKAANFIEILKMWFNPISPRTIGGTKSSMSFTTRMKWSMNPYLNNLISSERSWVTPNRIMRTSNFVLFPASQWKKSDPNRGQLWVTNSLLWYQVGRSLPHKVTIRKMSRMKRMCLWDPIVAQTKISIMSSQTQIMTLLNKEVINRRTILACKGKPILKQMRSRILWI